LVNAFVIPKTDERQHRGLGDQLELLLGQRREDGSLEADHGADERVHDHEQRELPKVLADPEANVGHARSPARRDPRARRPRQYATTSSRVWRCVFGIAQVF